MSNLKMKTLRDDTVVRKYKRRPYSQSGSPFDSWEEFIKYNETLPCNNPRCNRLRYGRAKLCKTCGIKSRAYGDPNLRPIPMKVFMTEIREVERMIQYNYGNALIMDFVEKITNICDAAARGLPCEYGLYFKHMDIMLKKAPIGVRRSIKSRSPYALLAELAGFYIFAEKDYGSVIKNHKLYDYMIGAIALYGVKTHINPFPTGKRVRRFSKVFQEMFGVYYIKVGNALMNNEREERKRKEMLENATFKIPKGDNE